LNFSSYKEKSSTGGMQMPATLQQIAEWSSVLTGESRNQPTIVPKGATPFVHYYYVTEPVKRLEWKLKNLKGQLVALIGLQGTGKTSALDYVERMFTTKK